MFIVVGEYNIQIIIVITIYTYQDASEILDNNIRREKSTLADCPKEEEMTVDDSVGELCHI